MQLVRNLYTSDRTRNGVDGYKRKIREAKLAEELENEHDKTGCSTKYLNTVPVRHASAARPRSASARPRALYFNKRVADLTLREAALLAGMPQAPSRLLAGAARPGGASAPQRGAGQDGRARDDHPGDRAGDDGARASACT